jgi:hypothetical protein
MADPLLLLSTEKTIYVKLRLLLNPNCQNIITLRSMGIINVLSSVLDKIPLVVYFCISRKSLSLRKKLLEFLVNSQYSALAIRERFYAKCFQMMSSTGKKHLDHGSGFLVYVIAKHNTTNH